ncbi:hypothetical protein GCM10022254_60350 [Actinomadura meridiana]|uniref:Secreted protein n=1 Tax=Actinomadura meridiana TaxID=559626 RepID=A0ABP8CI30_9ACTN
MNIRKYTLSTVALGAAALGLYGLGAGPAMAAGNDDAPKPPPGPPVVCSLDASAGPFVAVNCMGGGAIQLNVVCPAQKSIDGTINAFRGRTTLLDNRCHKGPTFASLTMFDMSTHKPGETVLPYQRVA